MDKVKGKDEKKALQRLEKFDYDPEKEKEGPKADIYSINKTLCAFYLLTDMLINRSNIEKTLKSVVEWMQSLEGNKEEAALTFFNDTYI